MCGGRGASFRRCSSCAPSPLCSCFWSACPAIPSNSAAACAAAILFASNVHFYLNYDYFAAAADTQPLLHTWSLAVEEQFYLAWPWLIVFAPRRWLMPAILACIAVAPVFRGLLAEAGYRESMLAILTPGCLDSLGMGALLAVADLAHLEASPVTRQTATVARPVVTVTVAAATLAWFMLLVTDATATQLPLALMAVKQTLQAIVFAWMVMRAATGFGGAVGSFLSAGPTVYLGKISYGLYLIHLFMWPLFDWLSVRSSVIRELPPFAARLGLTILLATAMWHLVEAPILKLKERLPY
jgi:peptidoglycan/LPS O-acetylase OafA/YrhL